MADQTFAPKTLMPKWWQTGTTALLYGAYLLWLLPIVLYFRGDVGGLGAFGWLAAVVVAQFVLVKLITYIEFASTAKKIEQLRADEDASAQSGEPK